MKIKDIKLGQKTYTSYSMKAIEVDKENFSFRVLMSTDDEDRHGDVVVQNWDLKNYKKNPVLLNSHNYDDITEIIGRVEKVKVTDEGLEGTVVFAVNENPKAKIIFDLYAGGFASAFSVGFIPLEFDKDFTILKSELLELSAVSVPANAMALAKSAGIDVEKLTKQDDQPNNPEGEPAPKGDEPATAGNGDGGEAGGGNGDAPNNGDTGVPAGEPKSGEPIAPVVEPEPQAPVPGEPDREKAFRDALNKMAQEVTDRAQRRQQLLKTTLHVINTLGENPKVETRTVNPADRAKEKRLINQAIRKLIKEIE